MKVKSSRHSYDVVFTQAEAVLGGIEEHDRIVIDAEVERLWPQVASKDVPRLSVPSGEQSKCLDLYGKCLSWLAQSGASRKTRVFAVGGGVVGDLAGFVASSFMRGLGFVLVPTTLLSMVDSSVGGKVAIDLPEGKNLVGAFWPPDEVRVASRFLDTLPEREFVCGAAEVWKYGYILDPELLSRLESQPLVKSATDLDAVIERCVGLKAQVVQEDERETTGRRAILNFGHTIGHAIEALQGYCDWNHGEAISVGMVGEAKVGELLGVTPQGTAERVKRGLHSQGLPTTLPNHLDRSLLVEYAKRDKKSGADGLGFSLLTMIGECKLVPGVSEDVLKRVLTEL